MFKKFYLFLTLLTAFLWLGSGTMWGAQSLPYSYGFETDLLVLEDGWTKLNETSTNDGEFGIVGVAKKTGYYGFRFSSYDKDGAGNYNQYLFSPEFDAPNGLIVSFQYRSHNTSGPELFKVGYSTTNTDVASFTWVDNISYNKTSWTKYENTFPAGTKYIAIYYYSTWKYRLYVDDFTFEAPASCLAPTNVTATQNTPVKATLSWTKAEGKDNYQYLYVAKNGTPNWEGVVAQNTNSVELDNLTAGTEYDFYVRTYCNGDDQSTAEKKTFSVTCPAPTYPTTPVTAKTATTATIAWNAVSGMTKYQYVCVAKNATPNWSSPSETTGTSADIDGLTAYTEYDFYVRSWYSENAISEAVKTTFRTECAAVNAPYTWDFEDYTNNTVPGCWDNSASGSTTISSSPENIWGVYSASGNKVLRMYNFDIKAGTALINSPSINLPASPAQELVFDYSNKANCGDFVVKISTNGGASFTNLGSYGNSASGSTSTYDLSPMVTDETISLSAYAGQTIILQFFATANYDAGAIFVDNVKIQNAASCPKPTGLEYSEKAAHSVKLSWTSAASAWKVEYAENSSFTGSTIVPATTNPFTLSGLDANTHYYVRVLADCGTDGESEPTAAIDFTTKCEDATLPLTEDFEGGALPECWTAAAQWATYAYSSGHNSSTSMRFNASTTSDLTLRDIYLDDNAQLSFWRQSSYVSCGVYINDGSGLTQLGENFAKSSSWKKDSVDLSAYKGKTVTLVIRGNYYGSGRYLYIDDIAVTYKPVALPTDLAAEATADGANVTWNSTEGTSWNLQYREKDAEPEAAWIPVNGLTAKNHTLTGLSTEKTYEVQVQAVCSENRKSEWTASATFSPESCASVETVTYGAKTYNSIVVNWTTSGAGTWDIHYKAAGDANWTSAGTGLSEATKTLTGLSTGVAYTVEVKASCSDTWVAGEVFTLAYSKPASASVTDPTDVAASASWSAVGDAPNGYEYIVVARDAAEDWTNSTATNETSASLSNLNAGTEYDFYVRAIYGLNHGAATKAQFSTTTIAPQNLQQDGESTTTSATFTWEANGAATQYQWSIDNTNWSAAQTELTATAEGLNSGADYTFYVRSYYAENIYSSAISLPFQTQCATRAIGYSQNFDDASALPACWESTNFGSGNNKWNIGSSWYEYKSASNSARFYAYKNSGSATADLITPAIELTAPALLKFFYLKNSSDVVAQVLIRISGEEDEVISTLSNRTSWGTTAEVIDLSSYVGKTAKLIFRAYGSTSNTTRSFYLDNVSVEAKPCTQLQNLTAVPNLDGADISWEQGEDETQYQYCVVDEGEEPVWTAAGILADGVRTVTIEGKTVGNTYDCYVRSYCSATNQSEPLMVQFTPSCVAPSDLAVSAIIGNNTSLSWTSKAKALRYKAEGEDWTNVTIDPVATTYNLSGLNGSTAYTVQVQAACAADENEYWSDEIAFTTKCALAEVDELPLNEDFSAGVKPACWDFISETEYPTVTNEKIWFQGTNEQIVVLPGYDIELNKLHVSFDYTTNNSNIELGYYAANGGAFQSLGAVTSGADIDLSTTSAPAAKGYLAIRYYDADGIVTTGSVDNVRVYRKITLADTDDNSETIAAYMNKTVDVTIGRTLVAADYYNTICLPFDVPTLTGTPLEGGDLWAFKYAKVENEELLFRIIEADHIEAGVPYLIAFPNNSENIVNPLFKNVTIAASAGQAVGDASIAQFVGILKPETFEPGIKGKLFLYENNTLYWWNGGAASDLKSFRAYFNVNTNSGANYAPRHGMKARIIKSEQSATDVDNIYNNDVQSIKLLENNQVVIIRNGVKYNVQGQVIR